MNIMFVIGSLVYGGAETQVMVLAKALVAKGHTVTIYTLTDKVPRLDELRDSGVCVVVDHMRHLFDINIIFRIRSFIRDTKIDVVHGVLFDGDICSRLAVLGQPVFLVNSERNWKYEFTGFQTIIHYLTRFRVNCLVANSQSGLEFAAKRYSLNENKMFAVWNGINIQEIDARIARVRSSYKKEFFDSKEVKLACFVGSIKQGKDILFALAVAEKLVEEHAEWRVLFLGEKLEFAQGKYEKQVLEKYESLPLKDSIRFVGNRDDALEIISQSDVLFSTSLIEGFPNVVLEAMTAQTPVVSTGYSDISLILGEAQIEKERDVSRYIKRLLHVVSNGDQIVAVQREFVENNCTMDMLTACYEGIYEAGVKARKA